MFHVGGSFQNLIEIDFLFNLVIGVDMTGKKITKFISIFWTKHSGETHFCRLKFDIQFKYLIQIRKKYFIWINIIVKYCTHCIVVIKTNSDQVSNIQSRKVHFYVMKCPYQDCPFQEVYCGVVNSITVAVIISDSISWHWTITIKFSPQQQMFHFSLSFH